MTTGRAPREDPPRRTARIAPVVLAEWFLAAAERGNPDTRLLARHPESQPWSTGNDVRPLVHGSVYFRELLEAVRAMGTGDLLLFTDWRGDPDERLDGPGSEVGPVFAAAAARGVEVRGLVWRSHFDRFAYSASENRHLGAEIEVAGGSAFWTCGSERWGRTTRSWWCCGTPLGPRPTSPSSAASICAMDGVTTQGTGETPRVSRWRSSMEQTTVARHPGRGAGAGRR